VQGKLGAKQMGKSHCCSYNDNVCIKTGSSIIVVTVVAQTTIISLQVTMEKTAQIILLLL
jgi:hypothetical protein